MPEEKREGDLTAHIDHTTTKRETNRKIKRGRKSENGEEGAVCERRGDAGLEMQQRIGSCNVSVASPRTR